MKDEELRVKRLVYYKEEFDQIEQLLEEFLKLSDAMAVFLIDTGGHLISQKGKADFLNPETLSALVAGSFAATKEMAKLLGEPEFSVMFHQGKKDHIHISVVGDRAMVAIVFDDKTTVGMITLYSKELTEKLGKLFDIASRRSNTEKELDSGFTETVRDKLDEMFDE